MLDPSASAIDRIVSNGADPTDTIRIAVEVCILTRIEARIAVKISATNISLEACITRNATISVEINRNERHIEIEGLPRHLFCRQAKRFAIVDRGADAVIDVDEVTIILKLRVAIEVNTNRITGRATEDPLITRAVGVVFVAYAIIVGLNLPMSRAISWSRTQRRVRAQVKTRERGRTIEHILVVVARAHAPVMDIHRLDGPVVPEGVRIACRVRNIQAGTIEMFKTRCYATLIERQIDDVEGIRVRSIPLVVIQVIQTCFGNRKGQGHIGPVPGIRIK